MLSAKWIVDDYVAIYTQHMQADLPGNIPKIATTTIEKVKLSRLSVGARVWNFAKLGQVVSHIGEGGHIKLPYCGESGIISALHGNMNSVTIQFDFVHNSKFYEGCFFHTRISAMPSNAMVACHPMISVPRFWEMMRVLYTHSPAYTNDNFEDQADVTRFVKENPSFITEESGVRWDFC